MTGFECHNCEGVYTGQEVYVERDTDEYVCQYCATFKSQHGEYPATRQEAVGCWNDVHLGKSQSYKQLPAGVKKPNATINGGESSMIERFKDWCLFV